ncbi:thymidine kinase, cytosolic-like isoform X1 [Xenia sp. Carnegie-2017]|uniref:thymidine kinase, cytosolic-like isoform X1 n=1 Tax=Xenia sp. Carnegie-2017 TaxID=2897299 RepID=UPI001F045B5F|nr:thymidine kinase, cytosolic-like isoform X1 [Xenia sp. Carnegie-2017]
MVGDFITVFTHLNTTQMACVTVPGLLHHASQCKGQIQVIFGPMFSGKTTELMRRVKRYQFANHSCLLIKYEQDDRYDERKVSTHDKQRMGAVPCHQLFKVKGQAMKYNVIGIDEGQFFPDIAEFCEELANKGKTVIVAALDGTFQRQAFGNVLSLVPLAESVVKLNAVCMNCFKDAAFSMRLGSETQVKLIGGAERYWSVCRECFHLPKYYDIVMKLQNTHDQN